MKTLITICTLMITTICYSQTKIENVDAATFKKMIDEKKSTLIDLRTNDELKNKGFIYISEPLSTYESIEKQEELKDILKNIGFKIVGDIKCSNKFVYITAIKK